MEEHKVFDWEQDVPRALISRLPQKSVYDAGRNPTGWLTIGEHLPYSEAALSGGVSSVFLDQDVFRKTEIGSGWLGRDLGEFQIIGNQEFREVNLGLFQEMEGGSAEFVCQGRRPDVGEKYIIEISLPFLWFWEAYLVGNEWRYLSPGGNEKQLMRFQSTADSWMIEVRAEELRTYLHIVNKKLLVQIDFNLPTSEEFGDRLEFNHQDEWGTFQHLKYRSPGLGQEKRWTSIDGFYYIEPRLGKTRPHALEWLIGDDEYPDYLIGHTPDGDDISFSCNPDLLQNYFGSNPNAPHYLTPVFFSREVLDKYTTIPSRYRVSTSRLECLRLWGVDLSINEYDLVVVYLGDLGKKIPSEERRHWLNHNVSPEGSIDEGRFRRDFLGQWASSPDNIRDIRNLVTDINTLSSKLFGFKLWRDPAPQLQIELSALVGPSSSDPTALHSPVLTLTKWLIDSLDSKKIRQATEEVDERAASLQNLSNLLKQSNLDDSPVEHLRNLQALRSRGGVAHLPNSNSRRTFEQLGIDGSDARKDFSIILKYLLEGLQIVRDEMESRVDLQ